MLFPTRLLKKMNVEAHLVHEPVPNFETRKAMWDNPYFYNMIKKKQ